MVASCDENGDFAVGSWDATCGSFLSLVHSFLA